MPQHDGSDDRVEHQISAQEGAVFEGEIPGVGQRGEGEFAADFEERNGGVDDGHLEQYASRVERNPSRVPTPSHDFVRRRVQRFQHVKRVSVKEEIKLRII